jgi:tellurite resistance protein
MGILIVIGLIWLFVWAINWDPDSESPTMGDFEVRLFDEKTGELGLDAKRVQIRGLVPLVRATNLGFVVVLDDVTDSNKPLPIISLIEICRAEKSVCFCHSGNIGIIEPGQGWPSWVNISAILPSGLQTPFSGRRRIRVRAFLYDINDKPDFSAGYISSSKGLICAANTHFHANIVEPGYQEEEENKKEAQLLAIQIAMGLSFSDGSFDKEEGKIIKEWAKKNINLYPEENREGLKAKFNDIFKESYEKAKSDEIDIDSSIERLRQIGDNKSKHDVLELCHSVMAADGEIDSKEVEFIDQIAKKLDINADALSKMKDSLILSFSDTSSLENILGIDTTWTQEEIKKHLRKEFQKWNNRINTLPEGTERDRAQSMLDNIAEARKKYSK